MKGNDDLPLARRLVSHSTEPSHEQCQAIAILQHGDFANNLAWYRSARLKRHSGAESRSSDHRDTLSKEEADAIAILQDCPEQNVRRWLQLAKAGTSGFCTTLSAHLPESSQSSIHQASKSDAPYCCTCCGPQHAYKKISDWKRHEKGHEIAFHCMHKTLLGVEGGGNVCTYCGILNPDRYHLDAQNVGPCAQMIIPYSCKRRVHMVEHLSKQHYINNTRQAQAIADSWKTDTEKQAWSCGFCIRVFTNFEDRLKHIAQEYRENHHTYGDWDISKVIKGLLLQPDLRAAWNNVLQSCYGIIQPSFIWNTDTVGDLQNMLEKGPSPTQSPHNLAQAAFAAAECHWDAQVGPIPVLTEVTHQDKTRYDHFRDSAASENSALLGFDIISTQSSASAFRESDGISFETQHSSAELHPHLTNTSFEQVSQSQSQLPSACINDEEDFGSQLMMHY